MKILSISILFWLFSNVALSADYNIMPTNQVMPCERTIKIQEGITKAVIPMTPFRGVNLIFPFKLFDDKTSYTPSGSTLWNYKPAKGGKMVPIFFKTFTNQWGEINDFTIASEGFIFSLALIANPDIRKHCTNIVFKLSGKLKKQLEAKKKKEQKLALDNEYEIRFKALDDMAHQKALKLVSSFEDYDPSETSIYEEKAITTDNGDNIKAYIDVIKHYKKFSIIKLEVTNDSSATPLYIKSVVLGQIVGKGGKKVISGYADFKKKINVNDNQKFSFTTLESVPDKKGYLIVKTDQGDIEVYW